MDFVIEIWRGLLQSNNMMIVASTLTVILGFIAWRLSLFTPNRKEILSDTINETKIDMVDGLHDSYERQLKSLTDRLTLMDDRLNTMSDELHNHKVRLTRLQVLVMQMNGLLSQNGVVIPDYMRGEMAQLLEGAH